MSDVAGTGKSPSHALSDVLHADGGRDIDVPRFTQHTVRAGVCDASASTLRTSFADVGLRGRHPLTGQTK